MSVRVENHCQTPIPLSVESLIQELLRKVPQEHIVGLDTIVLVDQVTHKESRRGGVRGLYWQKRAQRSATIELAPGLIYCGMPRIFFYLPFVAKIALANVLYHEIGHHYQQRLAHGVTKGGSQNFAEKYKKQMFRKVFFWWLLLAVPLVRLIRWLNCILGRSRSGVNT